MRKPAVAVEPKSSRERLVNRLLGKPVRTCQSFHSCCLCSQPITLGQRYHDGGYGARGHEACLAGRCPRCGAEAEYDSDEESGFAIAWCAEKGLRVGSRCMSGRRSASMSQIPRFPGSCSIHPLHSLPCVMCGSLGQLDPPSPAPPAEAPRPLREAVENLIGQWMTSEEYCLCCDPEQENMRHDPDQPCPVYELEQILAKLDAQGPAEAVAPPAGLEFVVAQLRHAYQQLLRHDERWSRRGMREFADGLLAPQIRKLEQILREAQAEGVPAPQDRNFK